VQSIDSNGIYHGNLRAANGKFTQFDPTGSLKTQVTGINSKNTVVGVFYDSGGLTHGFVRKANGTDTQIDVPNALDTLIYNINSSGASVGPYYDSTGLAYGFILNPNGSFTKFSVSGAAEGTFPNSNNLGGSITGNWTDSNGVNQRFHSAVSTKKCNSTEAACSRSGFFFGACFFFSLAA